MIKKAVAIIAFVLVVCSIAGCITNNTNQTTRTLAWSDWKLVGNDTAPNTSAAVSSSNGRLDLFAIGTDNGIWHRSYVSSGWSDWEQVGDSVASATSPAVSASNGQLDLFAIGTDYGIYHRSYA